MKTFLIVLLAVAMVAAGGEKMGKKSEKQQKGESKERGDSHEREDPRCKNLTKPVNVTIEGCCPSIPKPLGWLSGKACFAQCGGKDMHKHGGPKDHGKQSKPSSPPKASNGAEPQFDVCCLANCTVFNYTTNGALDVKKIVAALTANMTTNKDAWTSGLTTIVTNCIANASAELKAIKDKIAAETTTTANPNAIKNNKGHKHECFFKKVIACDTAIATNFIAEKCIEKNAVANCPTKSQVTDKNCPGLYTYAEQCPSFVFRGAKGLGDMKHDGKGKGKGSEKKN